MRAYPCLPSYVPGTQNSAPMTLRKWLDNFRFVALLNDANA